MAFGSINLQSQRSRVVVYACLVVSLVIAIFMAKWCFANAVSIQNPDKQAADLAVSLGPGDPQTHYAAAVMYERSFDPNDLDRSLAEYETVAALSPDNYLSWLELARARDRRGDQAGAEAAYLRTLALAPNYADIKWAYGNSLVRAGRVDEGFALIRVASAAKPELAPIAVETALALSGNDLQKVRDMLGNTGGVNLAIAKNALSKKDLVAAAAAWSLIPDDEQNTIDREDGRNLYSQLASAKKFRLAAQVVNDIVDTGTGGPQTGSISDGGFEMLVRPDPTIFDWLIATGAGQQIGLSDERTTAGKYSLYMIFDTMQAIEFRQVSQTVAVEPGVSYSLTGSCRSELKGGLAWEIVDAADSKPLGRTQAMETAADWKTFRANFTVPTTTDGVIVRLVRDGCSAAICAISGKVWFDDLKLAKQ